MHIQKVLLSAMVFALLVVSGSLTAGASQVQDLPDKSGVYDVPGKPHMKLKVFVHHLPGTSVEKAKPAKPTPPPPASACYDASIADPDSSAVTSGSLKLPSVWTYRLNPSSVPSTVGSANLATIAANSYKAWTDAVSGVFTITRGADTTLNRYKLDGQNIVTWGRTSASALAVSYMWYYTTTSEIVEVDTIMNQSFKWTWNNPDLWPDNQVCAYTDYYDAQNIMTHEFGHTFGLDDHYEDSYMHNTMYGYGSPSEVKKNTLTAGDAEGIQWLYR